MILLLFLSHRIVVRIVLVITAGKVNMCIKSIIFIDIFRFDKNLFGLFSVTYVTLQTDVKGTSRNHVTIIVSGNQCIQNHKFLSYYSTGSVDLRAAQTLLERFRSKSYNFNT